MSHRILSFPHFPHFVERCWKLLLSSVSYGSLRRINFIRCLLYAFYLESCQGEPLIRRKLRRTILAQVQILLGTNGLQSRNGTRWKELAHT